MKKCLVIGKFADKNRVFDGQTVKCKTIFDSLTKKYGASEISKIDTYGWKKQPIGTFFHCVFNFMIHKNTIIMPASNGIKVFGTLFYILNKITFKKHKIHYIVIGSWLYDLLLTSKNLTNKLKQFDAIFVETTLLKKNLKSLGFNNIITMRNFKDICIVKNKESETFKQKTTLRLCIFSRINEKKGIEDAVLALQLINKKRAKITLDIYGPIDQKFAHRFDELLSESKGAVSYKNVIAPSDSTKYITQYDALLFPTKYYTEGIPGTIIDAYASGVPVIVSRWQNYRDIIQEGKTGITFEFNSLPDLVDKLEYAYNHQRDLSKMVKYCLRRAAQYCSENTLNPMFEVLRSSA